ncbi:hypothetical protein ABH931_002869 [Streptacidiphilus sp. MAP12-33]
MTKMRLRREDPRLVGPYRLHRRLGAGGMGVVFLGSDRKGQKVALKLIRAELAEDPEFRTRFAREVAAAARIRGGCIARLVSSDIEAERPWLATVYVPGPSLYKRVGDEGPLPWAEVAAIGAALADGLAQVHDAGVVHRDLKPSNILLSPKGPRIIDFGIAWSSGASTLTHVGTAVGSPGFLAPEQVRGVSVTGATDVFALGSTLAYAATGDTPFGSGSSEVMLYRVVHEEPDLTGLPAALAPLIRSCLAKDPSARPTPAQVHDRLRELAARGAAIGRSIAPQAHGHGYEYDAGADGHAGPAYASAPTEASWPAPGDVAGLAGYADAHPPHGTARRDGLRPGTDGRDPRGDGSASGARLRPGPGSDPYGRDPRGRGARPGSPSGAASGAGLRRTGTGQDPYGPDSYGAGADEVGPHAGGSGSGGELRPGSGTEPQGAGARGRGARPGGAAGSASDAGERGSRPGDAARAEGRRGGTRGGDGQGSHGSGGARPESRRPAQGRRPLPPTMREPVEGIAAARRPGEQPRRPAPPAGTRTPHPARRPSGGGPRTPAPGRPGGPAARRRLLRQRLIVFITVTIGVALAIATAQGCENRTAKGSGPARPAPQGVNASQAAPAAAQDASSGLAAVATGDAAAQAVAAVDWGSRSYQDPADGSRIDLSNGHGTGPGAPVTLTAVLPARYQGDTAAVVVLTRRDRAVPEDMIELYRLRSGAEPVLLAAHATTGDPNGTSTWLIQNGAVLREERTPQSAGRTVSTTRYTIAAKGTMTETWPGTGAASTPASPASSPSGSPSAQTRTQALGATPSPAASHG